MKKHKHLLFLYKLEDDVGLYWSCICYFYLTFLQTIQLNWSLGRWLNYKTFTQHVL